MSVGNSAIKERKNSAFESSSFSMNPVAPAEHVTVKQLLENRRRKKIEERIAQERKEMLKQRREAEKLEKSESLNRRKEEIAEHKYLKQKERERKAEETRMCRVRAMAEKKRYEVVARERKQLAVRRKELARQATIEAAALVERIVVSMKSDGCLSGRGGRKRRRNGNVTNRKSMRSIRFASLIVAEVLGVVFADTVGDGAVQN